MKKALVCILLIFLIAFSACAPPGDGGVVVRGTLPPDTDADSAYVQQMSDIVYVTESGTKYHREGCAYLKDSCIPVSLEQAVAEGKTPCSRCWPNQQDTTAAGE